MNFDKDQKLLQVFKDKRVAIVGPSPHLIGKKLGKHIDSYDIVCRVNEVCALGYEEDYGTRTDIVFHNCGTRFIDIFGERLKESENISKNLKYVICPCVKATGADNQWFSWPANHVSPVVENFKKINFYNIPFYWIGLSNYRRVYNIYGVEPNAGQTSILLLLQHNIKELFITGFSFYIQGNTPSEAHRPGHTNKGLENESIGNPGHPQIPQMRVFKNVIYQRYKDKIVVDPFLKNLLNI